MWGLARSWVGGYKGGMSAEPPIARELWDTIPPDAQAAILALVQAFERRIAALEARLGQDSSNSSRPPSSDPPHVKRPRPGRRRGRGGAGSPGTGDTPASWSRPSG